MKRLRLTLGPRQAERLLLALSYAIDTYLSPRILDEEFRCRFCKKYVIDGLYTRVSFPDGIANVCDICREKADEPDEDVVEWRDTEVQVTD